MGFTSIREIPSPQEIKELVSLPDNLKNIKAKRDEELKKAVISDGKFLVIVGPCSADDEDSVCDYVTRLAAVQEKVADNLFLIPRIYTNKPRSTGEGYKGMLHQPNPEEAPNMLSGIIAMRKIHIRSMRETGLIAADEMLYPENTAYCDDIVGYFAIGARSVENQQHRLVASGLDLPVGMKNPTNGDLNVLFNSIQAVQKNHSFIYQSQEVETDGNLLSHAVLRGFVDRHGKCIPNYHFEDLLSAAELYGKRCLANPMIITDVSHANSGKVYTEQPRIVREILQSRKRDSKIEKTVRGLMIESYIAPGAQEVSGHVYGKSITDACLGWEDTERILYYIADNV